MSKSDLHKWLLVRAHSGLKRTEHRNHAVDMSCASYISCECDVLGAASGRSVRPHVIRACRARRVLRERRAIHERRARRARHASRASRATPRENETGRHATVHAAHAFHYIALHHCFVHAARGASAAQSVQLRQSW